MPMTQKEREDALYKRIKIRNEQERKRQAALHANAVEAEKRGK